jgi:hypothetical protein
VPRRRGELRPGVAQPQADDRPLPGQQAQDRHHARPGHRDGGPVRGRGGTGRAASTERSCSASCRWTAGCDRCRASCRPRWRRPRPASPPSWSPRPTRPRPRSSKASRSARCVRCVMRSPCSRACRCPPTRRCRIDRSSARRGRPAGGSTTWTSARCSVKQRRATVSRSPRPAGTTCSWRVHPAPGKTMLAERLPGLLPDLSLADALEVSAIHSVAGILDSGAPLSRRPPVPRSAPHRQPDVDRGWRWPGAATRGDVAGPSRRPVPRRGAGVLRPHVGGHAPAAGER